MMLHFMAVLLAAACWVSGGAEAARILAVMPMPSPSHLSIFSSVTKGLAARGHDVTFISSVPLKGPLPPSHKVVVLSQPALQEDSSKDVMATFLSGKSDAVKEIFMLYHIGEILVNGTFSDPVFQAEINKPGVKFDLVIAELFFFVEAFCALGHKFNAPVVAVNPFGTHTALNDVVGNPVNPSWVPSPFLGYSHHMTLYQRTLNTLFAGYIYAGYYLFHLPKQQALVSAYLPDAPPLRELLSTRLALTLVNNHHTLFYPAPMSPNVVEIGGLQISDNPKPLPKNLKDILDGAEHGVVYFSMGSNLKMQLLEKKKAEAILEALGSLKQQVILKWDGPKPKVASNVHIVDWVPQADLLTHPNLRLFVSHGGLLSTQEAVYNGVPIVGLPVFGDQNFNMLVAVSKGFAVKVDLQTITRKALEEAIKEVLGNPKYSLAVKQISARFRAKPQKPLDAAMFWVEHVLEHGGDHLRPSSVHLAWYQLLLLDVLLVLLTPVLLLSLCCWTVCCRRRKAARTTSSSKKTN